MADMGITNRDDASPSLLTDRWITVPTYRVPRVLTELQQERLDSEGRVKYQRVLEANQGLTWAERRSKEIEEAKRRRSEREAAS